MRIIGEIAHPVYKITIFRNDNRVSVKLEKQGLELTWKFRDGEGVEQVADVETLLDEAFMQQIDKQFQQMQQLKYTALQRFHKDALSEFEEII